jgi:hypothetical protein
MGAWGAGLYADDYAVDLKQTVATLCRLPRSGDDIVRTLSQLEPAATAPDDADHTTFWLVVADQLHRRGVESAATIRALRIIDERSNLEVMRAHGMSERDVRARASNLETLRARLSQPPPPKTRRTLTKPQPFVVQPGQVYAYRVDDRGRPYNAYFTKPERATFVADAWGGCVVLAAGHAFEYLAWYQLAPGQTAWRARPSIEEVVERVALDREGVGTLSRAHVRRMGFELLGTVEPPGVDAPTQRRIISVVASDIGVVNFLSRSPSSSFS